ncbi:hypothetical protein WS62_07780 [Burkholderia sp. ABCPW 14]|uniref:hypothetical protein n=1 Tax=Burkholderia sp. ABCPW 14 TaxID=1637860 RepID=UPI000770CE43|nr:hypothetical protein [Burkholderia sp. ABCPW 14]KVD73986.1 hypothetical protein WS62_07780 [Burkholderia sp. ABCPW 14]
MPRINALQHAGVPRRDTLPLRTVVRYERNQQLPSTPILVGKHIVMRRPLVDGVYTEYLIMYGNRIAARQISIPDESDCAAAINRLRAAMRPANDAARDAKEKTKKSRALTIREAA